MKLSLAENRMYTCPGYEESTCGVREEKRAEKWHNAEIDKKNYYAPPSLNQINLKMMNRTRKRSNRDY